MLNKKLIVVDNLSNIFLINLENGDLIWKKKMIIPLILKLK